MKILLISHTCCSSYNNMGKTFLSLFSQFRREELCQLYIYPSLPDVDVCESYYRITDKEALKGIVPFSSPGGELNPEKLVFGKPELFEKPDDAALYQRKSNSEPLTRLLRDAMWKLSHWYTRDLKDWVARQKPTCIFLAPGYAKLIYDIALRISRDFRLPIVTYVCDDYYFVNEPVTRIGKMQLALLKRKIDRLMDRTGHLVVICEEMKQVYQTHFGVSSSVVMTGTSRDVTKEPGRIVYNEDAILSYFGNIVCNRYVSLAQIGEELDRINEEEQTQHRLKIYTSETRKEILSRFDGIRSVQLCGFVSGDDFVNAMSQSDFLVHTEAFDQENMDLVKHSVSTKIADSLASGIPLLAYGPEQIASMRHLIRMDCAFAATSQRQLGDVLRQVLSNEEERRRIVGNAYAAAKQYHDADANSRMLRNILEGVQNTDE